MQFLERIIGTLKELKNTQEPLENDRVLDFLSIEIIWLLQKAILAGEYYDLRNKKASTYIIAIQDEISDFETLLSGGGLNLVIALEGEEIKKFSEAIIFFKDKYLKNFLTLAEDVNNRLNSFYSGKDGYISEINSLANSPFSIELTEIMKSDKDVQIQIYNNYTFQVNLLLAYLDDSLECTEEIYSILKKTKSSLENLKPNKFGSDVIRKLIDKVNILAFKINFRNTHKSKENYIKPRTSLVVDSQNSYYEFYKKIDKHYNELREIEIRNLLTEVYSMDGRNITSLKAEPFHHLNRYYKNTSEYNFPEKAKYIENLEKKLNEFKPVHENLSLYNKIAYASIEKLLTNSELGLFLRTNAANYFPDIISHFQKYIKGDEKNPAPVFLNGLQEKLKTIADEEHFPDYHCYTLLIKFLNDFVSFLIKQPNLLLSPEILKIEEPVIKSKIDSIIKYNENIYTETIRDLENSLDKMITHDVKPVYMTEEECFVSCKWAGETDEPGELFLRSSYILPNNFEKLSNKIHFWKSFLPSQLSHLKDAFDITINQSIIVSNLNNAEKKIKENEFKLVQIVAMFVSIATFVLINVKIFDNKTSLESFGIILGLAACFFLFNLFFYIIILIQYQSEKDGWKFFKKSLKYLSLPVLFLAVGLYLLHSEKGKTTKQFEAIQKRFEKDSADIDVLKRKINPLSDHK